MGVKRVARKFHWRNALIGAVLYIGVFITLFQTSRWLSLIALVYVLSCVLGARAMIHGAESRESDANTVEFSRFHPAKVLGNVVNSFQYVFECPDPVIERVQAHIAKELTAKLGASVLKTLTFADIDRDLPKPESRAFGFTKLPPTTRN